MFGKKQKWPERIVPGFSRTADSRPFFIPKITKLEDKESMKQKFVSPIFGKAVKDEVSVPTDRSFFGDIDKKYDAFRTTKKLTKEEAKKRYGSSYYEFLIVNNEDRSKIHRQDLSVDELMKHPVKAEETPETPEVVVKAVEVPLAEFFAKAQVFESQPASTRSDADKVLEDIEVQTESEELDQSRFGPVEEEEDILFQPEHRAPQQEEQIKPVFADDFDYREYVPKAEQKILTPSLEPLRNQIIDGFKDYQFPSISMLRKSREKSDVEPEWVKENIGVINQTLLSFDIDGEVTNYTKGPTVTRYEVSLGAGVQTKRITAISDNIMMNLSAMSLRIEAPIPGKNTVGIEVPNQVRESVFFGDVADHPQFLMADDPLLLAVGLDIDANPVFTSVEAMPHGLVAGSTQSGKSVCIASIIASLLFRNRPDEVKLMLIDPKKVDLQQFSDIPHLVTPIIDEVKIAIEALKWTVTEMERRYEVLKRFKTINVKDYYRRRGDDPSFEPMPRLVVIVEEASDLLISGGNEVEDHILKLTQKSRAVGIHLLLATQRPSADILKGSIKANIPTRFAFKVPSSTDSSVVLDQTGAEKLLGKGDMLLSENGTLRRLQGAYLSPEEIEEITDFIKKQAYPQYLFTHDTLQEQAKAEPEIVLDELFPEVARYVVSEDRCSLNKITQEFGIGFNRATQIVSSLEMHGIVSMNAGTKPREVLIGYERLEEILNHLSHTKD
ncbi:MAG: DNA translocase FtsK [Candidatus Izemoplasmatales bacterium]|nr:DNA translocase FtsK [Candidatus Izemoplasmatales bacterium]